MGLLVLFQGCLIHVWFTSSCSPFWFLHPLKYFPVKVSSGVLIWLTTLVSNIKLLAVTGNTSCIHASYYLLLLIGLRRIGWFVLLFLKKVFYFFVKVLSFVFCLVNYDCDTCLPVNHSLVYRHPKILKLFFNLISSLV